MTALVRPCLRCHRSLVNVARQSGHESPAKIRCSDRPSTRSNDKDLAGEAIVDASCIGCGSADEIARYETVSQTVEPVFGKDWVAPPYALRLIAGERTGQHAGIERWEKGQKRRSQLCRGAG